MVQVRVIDLPIVIKPGSFSNVVINLITKGDGIVVIDVHDFVTEALLKANTLGG